MTDWLDVIGRSQAAWDALPAKGAEVDGHLIMPLPMFMTTRQRVAIVRLVGGKPSAYAPVWADRWEDAFKAYQATGIVPEEMRANVNCDEDEP